MKTEDRVGNQFEWETCAVCGQAVQPGQGARRVNHHGSTINVYSPSCLETLAGEPDPYLARLAKITRERELRRLASLSGIAWEDSGLPDGGKALGRARVLQAAVQPGGEMRT